MKKFLMLLTLVVAFVGFTACGKKESDTVRIGACGPLSGAVAVYGTSVKKGVEMAIAEINDAGGVDVGGTMKKIELVGFLNDEHNADKAKSAFNTLYDDGIDVFLGAVTSAPTEAVVTEAIETGTPVITATGTADYITVGADGDEREDRSNIFRACFNDSYQGKVMARFCASNEYAKVAVLYNKSDSYSSGLYNAFVSTVTSESLNVSVTAFEYQSDTANFASYFTSITNDYDAVYVPDYYEVVANIVSTGREAGYTNAFLGGDGWDGITGVTAADLQNCYFSNHFAVDGTDAEVVKFVSNFKKLYNETPTVFAALGYDAVYIIKQAIEDCDSLDAKDIVAALSSKDFLADCVTGDITFDDNGNPIKTAYIMTFDEEGNLKFFKTQA